jgi:hypothetical protein
MQYGSASASGGDGEIFYSMGCADGVLVVVTSRRALYAELPCDRALPQSTVDRFLGKPIAVRAVLSNPAKLFLNSEAAGSIEFTVGRVWLRQL